MKNPTLTESQLSSWLNIAPDQQMQVLVVLMQASRKYISSFTWAICSCGDCLRCRTYDALALLESRSGKVVTK